MARSIIGYLTDVGRHRKENQDSYSVREWQHATLLVVADGMGGHRGGSVASRTAVSSIVHDIEAAEIQWKEPHQVNNLIEQAMLKANTEVFRASRESRENYNMGTTAIVVIIVGRFAYFGHIGDSRIYLARNGMARRLTTDHTSAQFLVEAGKLSPEEVQDHPESHRLMRAVGILSNTEPDIRKVPLMLMENDSLLLCSDGLYDVVEGREIGIALQKFHPQKACKKLVELANARGGPDNITIVVYRSQERDGLLEKAAGLMRRPYRGIPLYLWLIAGSALSTAAVLFGLALQ